VPIERLFDARPSRPRDAPVDEARARWRVSPHASLLTS